VTELLDNGSRETAMLRNFGAVYGMREAHVQRHYLPRHVRAHRARYRRARTHAEWIDVGGEG
jgi:hypothetical protein